MSEQQTNDNRRLELPKNIGSDSTAFELLSAWAQGGKVTVMTATGTGLDGNPAIWGEILVSVANNVALSIRETTGAEPSETLRIIKAAIERAWPPDPRSK